MNLTRSAIFGILVVGSAGCTVTGATDPAQAADASHFDFFRDGGCPPFSGSGGGSGIFNGGGPGTDTSPVVEPARPPPPISGGTLAVLPDDSIVVADSDRDRIYVVGADNQVTTLPLELGDEPGRVAVGPRGTAFIALRRAGAVIELDVLNRTIVARHEVCQLPRGLAWSQPRRTLYVACAGGELSELVDGRVTTRFVADDLRDVVVLEDGVLLSTFRNAGVIKRTHDGRLVEWPALARVVDGLGSSGQPRELEPRVAWRMVASGSGSADAVMIYQRTLVDLAEAIRCLPRTQYGGSGVGSSIAQAAIALRTPTGALTTSVLGSVVLPVDLAIGPGGNTFALVGAGSRQLLATAANGRFSGMNVPPGAQPVAVGYRSSGLLAVFSREPAQLFFVDPRDPDAKVPATISLDASSVKSTGHEIFHLGTQSGLACASCHPEGGEDGHTWILPEGKRRTPSLRGGLSSTAPFHWAGDMVNFRVLMSEVLGRRMGGTFQSEARMDAELAWLDTLPSLPAPRRLDPVAVERGRALFASAAIGCISCHAGALGTNNSNAGVGTGPALQVPRLLELAYRAPFFHDGRVPTLAARFTPLGGGDAHGHVSELTAGEVADLVSYLESR